ncbi:SPFH domain-containing protein [Dactylosporangium salmoneum]|uniref:Band 7 domain-containing protein n=1 Tax=Dactylosporangium salmoneum TaxID=53361 RepID=A0ABN3GKQ0_9ACTN
MDPTVLLAVLVIAVALIGIITVVKSVKVVPQQVEYVVERLGKYSRTLTPGLNILVPFIDSVRNKVDKREAVVNFPPQPVITSDNLVVSIDTVLYFKVVDSVRATYEIYSYLQAIEQLTVTTLRNVIGSLDLEKALTSRDEINRHLSGVLDETTGRWGIKVTRVEIKAIEPPPSIRDSMEKQMRAERDRRAAILHAEGLKQSQILTAEGEKQAAVLRAEGERQSRILTAEGQAKAIRTVVDSIHLANPDSKVMAYQYLQSLPQIAAGQSNKLWILPVELTKALEGIGGALGGVAQMTNEQRSRHIDQSAVEEAESAEVLEARRSAEEAGAAANAEAAAAAAQVSGDQAGRELTGSPGVPASVFDPQPEHDRDEA